MKILFITQLLPYPVRTGGTYKTFQVLSMLAQQHEVEVVTFHDKKSKVGNVRGLEQELGIRVKSFHHPTVTCPYREVKGLVFRSLLSHKPFRVMKYWSQEAVNYVRSVTQKNAYDVVWLDHNTAFQYLEVMGRRPKKVVLDEHNVNSLAMWRMAQEGRRHMMVRGFSLVDAIKNWFYERRMVREVGVVLAISEHDRRVYERRGGEVSAFLPTPYEVESVYRFRAKKPIILMVGLMSWAPNKLGFQWFYEEVYPLVKRQLDGVRLMLVGPSVDEELRSTVAEDGSVKVVGEVESLKPYYRQASVSVAPIWFGSGVRMKILDALAHGVPVVSTILGAEGIGEDSGVVRASSVEGFVEAVVGILTDRKVASVKSKQGTNFMRRNYSVGAAKKVLAGLGLLGEKTS